MQKIEIASFVDSSLLDLLRLPEPVFIKDDPYRQLLYLEDYLRDPKIGCESVLIEHHYIDRDYMEDHSVFYSKSLAGLPNHCKRLHFFKRTSGHIQAELERLYKISEKQHFRDASRLFSDEAYLGFSVIKPLNGCPVGRTVLKCFPKIRRFVDPDFRLHL